MVDASSSVLDRREHQSRPSKNRPPRIRNVAGLPRALPNTRAVIGSLLCVASALLAWFAATGRADVAPRMVVVAARDIPSGVALTADDIDVRPLVVPADFGTRTFSASEDLIGAVALGPMSVGDPVLRSVVIVGPAASPARQISLTLPVAAAVGGTLRSGDTVDVLATYDNGGDVSAKTVTLARRVLVSRVTGADPNVVSPTGDRLITFAVDPLLDIEQLVNASVVAKIHLVRTTGAVAPTLPNSPPAAHPTTVPGVSTASMASAAIESSETR